MKDILFVFKYAISKNIISSNILGGFGKLCIFFNTSALYNLFHNAVFIDNMSSGFFFMSITLPEN